MIACMGGWCQKRQQCPHYTEAARVNPEERLCLQGQDGVRAIETSPFRVILIDVLNGRELEQSTQ